MNYLRKNIRGFVAQATSFGKSIILVSLFSVFLVKANAQHSTPDTIQAVVIVEKIDFDGKLTEPIWTTATAINNFTQRELDFGKTCNRANESCCCIR